MIFKDKRKLSLTSGGRGAFDPSPPTFPETDNLFTVQQRADAEAILRNTSVPYQFSLYSGTNHGFGVRANVSDLQQRFGKESAFLQAVRWFQVMGSA